MIKSIYAFSGDPITYGHVDIVKRASKIFDEVVVAIGVNPDKKYTFTLEEREEMARHSLKNLQNVKVASFTGLLVDFAYEQGAQVIVKGVRDATDFEYEKYLNQLGESQKLHLDTVLLFADPKLAHVSSSAVRALQKEQGLIHEYVPLFVKEKIEEKLSSHKIIGVTGEIGVGKSYICQKIVDFGEKNDIEVHHIELDFLAHDIYETLQDPRYAAVRNEIAKNFGESVKNDDGTVSRKVLGELVFNDQEKLDVLNSIMYTPILVRLRRELYGKKGLILVNAALIAESDMAYISNNNVILVRADEKIQQKRLESRGLNQEQIKTRLSSQYDFAEKKRLLEEIIARDGQGKIIEIENNGEIDDRMVDSILNEVKVNDFL